MRRLYVSLLFLLASASTLAQVSPTTYRLRFSDISACPVGFYASRQATGQIMSAKDAKQPGSAQTPTQNPGQGPVQGLHLTLGYGYLASTPANIQSIEVTVYGTSLGVRVLPLAQQASDTISRTFEFHRTSTDSSLTDADVWMHETGSITAVDLISVTYTNGNTWHASPTRRCRAIPSNYLLIGNK